MVREFISLKKYQWWLIGAFGTVILITSLVFTKQGHFQTPTLTVTEVATYEPDYSFTPEFSPKDFDAALKRNRMLWESKKISHYTIDIDFSGMGYEQTPWIVEVKANEVVSITRTNGEILSSSEITNYGDLSKQFFTIPALFSFIEQTYQEQRPMLNVEYDSTFGYPNNIYVDPWIEPCCQDYWITIEDFHVLP